MEEGVKGEERGEAAAKGRDGGRAQPTKGKGREVERERWAKEREEGQGGGGLRGRWAPPPAEGNGPREGQRMAIGGFLEILRKF